MPADAFVPDELTLRQFLLGRLTGLEAERVERFLESHADAAKTMQALSTDDAFTAALRDQPSIDEADSEIQATISRLERLLPEAHERTTTRNDAGESQLDPDVGDETEDGLQFLAPAQSPGELGQLGGYRVLRVLGMGGMGMVLEADDPKLGRRVAIKVMRPRVAANPRAVKRFLQEARVAAAIEHDHIVPIWHIGEDNGVPFIVMPFLKGESLNARLNREDRLPTAELVRIGVEVVEGLAAAHEKGLVHRDIKPANLWLEAPRGRVRILDFGLARLTSQEGHLTQSGAIVGTPAYMAPEQARGQTVDARSDLFSVGATLYRAATGCTPFSGSDTMSMLMSLATDTPRPPRAVNPNLPPHLSELIVRLLEKDPARRPHSAREVIGLLAPPTVEDLPPDSDEHRAEFAFDDDDATEIEDPGARPAEPEVRHGVGRSKRGLFVVVAAAALLLVGGGGLGIYKLVFETKEGMLDIEISDAETEARFKNGELRLLDDKGNVKYTITASEANKRVEPGRYTVTVVGADGLKVETPTFTMTRGGRETVRVTARPPVVAVKDTDRTVAEWVLALGGVVKVNNNSEMSIKTLANLPKGQFALTFAFLRNCSALMDTDLARFAECANLAWLDLTDTPVGLTGLTHLKNCKRLTALVLDGTAVGDAAVGPLADCRKLTQLFLHNTKVTVAGVDRLHRALPECEIEWNGGVIERSSDPNRSAAQWVLSLGGTVRVNGGAAEIKVATQLPRPPFRLTHVWLRGNRRVTDTGLAVFNGCRDLHTLDLVRTPVTDDGLAHFKNCKNLELLDLVGTSVGDAGLAHFEGCNALAYLWLGNTKVSDRGLATFKDCALIRLDLEMTQVTDAGMVQFAGLRSLDFLGLGGTTVGDAGLAQFKDCRNLTTLRLDKSAVTDVSVDVIKRFNRLSLLTLQGSRISPAKVSEVRKHLPACKIEWDGGTIERTLDPHRTAAEWALGAGGIIRVSGSDRDVRGPAELAPGPIHLTRVDLHEKAAVVDADLGRLRDCKSLEYLDLRGTGVTDAGLENLKDLKDLQVLYLADTQVTDKGMTHFKDYRNLIKLALDNTRVSDAGLAFFKDCTTLTTVALNGTPVTDAGLAQLRGFKRLTHIGLENTHVKGPGLAELEDCKDLDHVDLRGTLVGDSDLVPIQKCWKLQNLYLNGTRVTDTGLAPFRDCWNLRHIAVEKTKVTAAQVEALKKALPKCRIEWDGGVIEPAADTDDRPAIAILLKRGGFQLGVRGAEGPKENVRAVTDLPAGPLRVEKITQTVGVVDETVLEAMKDLQHLQSVIAFGKRITDATAKALARSPDLGVIGLGQSSISDEGVKTLAGLTKLGFLSLTDAPVTDNGLAHLKALSGLSAVFLEGTKVTDAGLAHLTDLPVLAFLDLRRTKVTAEGVKKLAAARPACKITWAGGVVEPRPAKK
jgi:eukaryotic-like serine/threonine-protein kinase